MQIVLCLCVILCFHLDVCLAAIATFDGGGEADAFGLPVDLGLPGLPYGSAMQGRASYEKILAEFCFRILARFSVYSGFCC